MGVLRSQCQACPWRNMKAMRADFPDVVAHAEAANGEGFVCHTRCGPCPGPVLGLHLGRPVAPDELDTAMALEMTVAQSYRGGDLRTVPRA